MVNLFLWALILLPHLLVPYSYMCPMDNTWSLRRAQGLGHFLQNFSELTDFSLISAFILHLPVFKLA